MPGSGDDMLDGGMGGMMGSGMGGMMGSGMGGMMGGGGQTSASAPTYKQVRFYDFVDPKNPNSPKAGRTYVYRVRVALEDPNFPSRPALQPDLRYLSSEVYARVSQKIQEAEANGGKRDPRMWTSWSEISDPTELPMPSRVFAGPVSPAELATVRTGTSAVTLERKPAQLDLVALQWDYTLNCEVIVPLESRPGSVLAKSAVPSVVNPMDLSIKKTPDRLVDAQSVVVDVIGGEELKLLTDKEEELAAPGYMLLFNAAGDLVVQNDLDDAEFYRIYSFADERERAAAAAEAESDAGSGTGYPGAGGMPGGYPGAGGPPPGYPGAGGGEGEGGGRRGR
jgi:hypothetical protein